MYKGKHSKDKKHRLTPLAALALALTLVLSVGGTVAYLATSAGPVVNTFTPGSTEISIDEKTDGPAKTEIKVKNDGDVPVYVRVMLVATYQNSDNQVCGQHEAVAVPGFELGTDWVKGDDGFYYYTKAVTTETTSLIKDKSSITLSQAYDGCVMHIEILAQSIQAEPTTAVTEAWGVTVANDGTISK